MLGNESVSSLPPKIFSQSNMTDYQSGHMYSHPQKYIDSRFSEVQNAINERKLKLTDLQYPKYQFNKPTQEIEEEFDKFNALRRALHSNQNKIPFQSNPDYIMAPDLISIHRYRQPNCVTFDHSKTDSSYNSSCITINNRRYFALEGPKNDNLEYFYKLILNWDVSTIVCLTKDQEKGDPKCYPYWDGKVFQQNNHTYIGIPVEGQFGIPITRWDQKKLPFIHMPDWADHHGYEPNQLIEIIDQTRKLTPKEEVLAVHCSAGVGRTGTFIAIMALMDEIDSQIEAFMTAHPGEKMSIDHIDISIAKTFIELNLHRRPLVAKRVQYELLYKAVDAYLIKLFKGC